MIEENNAEFGKIHVHKEALADITAEAIKEIEGASLVPLGHADRFLEFFGKKSYSGIKISIDKDGQISIDVQIVVKYGTNIPTVGHRAQEAVRSAIERIADINIKDINVNVCGIERGNP